MQSASGPTTLACVLFSVYDGSRVLRVPNCFELFVVWLYTCIPELSRCIPSHMTGGQADVHLLMEGVARARAAIGRVSMGR
jgi:hypothetical protein